MKRERSNWRSVRLSRQGIERDLREHHHLRLHGACIGLLVMGLMWGTAQLQFLAGWHSLALRYLVTLGVGYAGYLLILRLWAAALVSRQPVALDVVSDLASQGVPDVNLPAPSLGLPSFQAGGGGDFAGGGATGDFAGDALGDVASGAIDAVSGSDDGAVVVVPVVAVFLVGLAVLFGAGSLLLLYFGWQSLLSVAVELSFSYVSGRTAVRVARAGWLTAVVRLTWKPLLGALLCAVLLGATIDHFIPAANSLPQAVKLIGASF